MQNDDAKDSSPQGPVSDTEEPAQSFREAERGEPAQIGLVGPTADFTAVYRTGNFGKHFGKVNVPRGKRWVLIHGALSLVMFIFTMAASVMMNDYPANAIRSILLAFSWMAAVSDWLTVVVAAFFVWRLSGLRHPLTTLMTMRSVAVWNFIFNIFFFLVAFMSILLHDKNFKTLSASEVGFVKAAFAIIAILMFIKTITAWAFFFMSWKLHSCCAGYCVFEEGEDLAPGVANSAGVGKIILVGQAAAAMSREL